MTKLHNPEEEEVFQQEKREGNQPIWDFLLKINNGPRENEKINVNINRNKVDDIQEKANATLDLDYQVNTRDNLDKMEVNKFVDTILSKEYKGEMNSRNARLPTTESEDKSYRNLQLKERFSKLEEIPVIEDDPKKTQIEEENKDFIVNSKYNEESDEKFVEDNFEIENEIEKDKEIEKEQQKLNEESNKIPEEKFKTATEQIIENSNKMKFKTIEEDPHQTKEPKKTKEESVVIEDKTISIHPQSIQNVDSEHEIKKVNKEIISSEPQESSPKNKTIEQFTNSSAKSFSETSKNQQTIPNDDTLEHRHEHVNIKVEDEKEDVLEEYLKKLEESLNDNLINNEGFEDYQTNKEVKKNPHQKKESTLKSNKENTLKSQKEKVHHKVKSLKVETKEPPKESTKEEVKSNKMFIKKITISDKFSKENVELSKKKSEETKEEPLSPNKLKNGLNTNKNSQRSEDKSPIKPSSIASPVKVFDNNSGFLYKKENQLSKEKFRKESQANLPNNLHVQKMAKTQLKDFKNKKTMKNRNNTAKTNNTINSNVKDFERENQAKDYSQRRGFSTSTKKINFRKYEDQKRNFLQLMKDPRNPYSTFWSDRILEKNYNLKIAVGGFCNGVPLIKLVKKKNQELPLLSKKINDLMNEDNKVENEIEFSTNRKNFFKARKDIEEDPYENRESLDTSGEIEFPVILEHLKK